MVKNQKRKRCPRCHIVKPIRAYEADLTRRDKLSYNCKVCLRKLNKLHGVLP